MAPFLSSRLLYQYVKRRREEISFQYSKRSLRTKSALSETLQGEDCPLFGINCRTMHSAQALMCDHARTVAMCLGEQSRRKLPSLKK